MSEPKDFNAMIDEQIKIWQSRITAKKKIWPTVSVSREYATGGGTIGEKLAKTLGFSYWNQKIVNKIAEDTGVSSSLVDSLDERSRSAVDDLIAGLILGSEGTEAGYVKQLYRVLGTIEEHGSAVVIGRGSQFILKPTGSLRVRIVAPFETRVTWVEKRDKVSKEQAQQLVQRIDEERDDFHTRYYNKDANNAAYYDLTVNVDSLTQDQAINVILATYKEKFGDLPQ